ncbi:MULTISPECIES: hypothetical protein [unclassified Clostridium]|uniref:hypothetical protein n=1 Tax=Clostridium TaxID=1485 RepID=UPI001C8C16D7|nr:MULTISPECIES: hypothetical protein [unclassified Clostridium]MDU2291917.1 hypothetical protein [Clostridium celatum]MDU4326625.1 hypothetical protein [Clostridium celatum]
MKYFIFLILILIIAFMYFYYEKKLTIAKNRILRTSNQFNNIRNEYRSALTKNQNINVQFLTPTASKAITNNNTTVFLAPILDSPKIRVLDIKMEVKILDSAIINNKTWFYVSLPIDSTYNCRGWINKDDFSFIYQQSQNTPSVYH